MGQLIGSFLEESEKQHEDEVVEAIRLLQKFVAAKLEAEADQMESRAFEDKSLPIVAVVNKVESYIVKVQNAPAEEIKKAISDIFQGEFLDGLEHIISAALNELLGNVMAGEKEFKSFHVVFANNSLLRVDYYMYKYDFSSKGLRDKVQNALCYVAQVAVLDLKKVDPQVVLYELDKTIGQGNMQKAVERLQEDAKYIEELYKVLSDLRVASAKPQSDE